MPSMTLPPNLPDGVECQHYFIHSPPLPGQRPNCWACGIELEAKMGGGWSAATRANGSRDDLAPSVHESTLPPNVPCQHLWASSKLKPDNTYHSDIWECTGCGIDVVHNKTFDGHVNGWRPLDGSALPVIKAPSPYSLHDSQLCTPGVPIGGETPGTWGGQTFPPSSFKVKATDGIAVLRKLYDEQRVHAMHMADELGNVSRDNRMLTIENSDLRREIDRLKRKK